MDNASPRLGLSKITLKFTAIAFLLQIASGQADQSPPGAPRQLMVESGIASIKVLSQNWSEEQAIEFYNIPQGSQLVPYDWFLKLEQADSQIPFRDPDNIRSLGYLPRTASTGNPDGLPIGFVRDGNHIGLTCAACHTAQINYKGTSWLIDGAPTLGDFELFLRRLVEALSQTLLIPEKFTRFSDRVLGPGAPDAMRADLRQKLTTAQAVRKAYNERNLPDNEANRFGPGRVDAIGAILNEVAVTFAQVPGNHSAANAPVSYPFLWDTPQHDYVEWNGSVPNTESIFLKPLVGTSKVGALGRNVGEVLGVFGVADTTREGNLLELKGYSSSVRKKHLIGIEESLRLLWSPQWPESFPEIKPQLKVAGQILFAEHCKNCHDPIQRDSPDRRVVARMAAIGTDQLMASNFAFRTAKAGVFKGRKYVVQGLRTLKAEEPVRDLLFHLAQRVVLRPEVDVASSVISDNPLWAPLGYSEYRVFAEVDVGNNQKFMGGFQRIDGSEGSLVNVLAREPLKFSNAGKVFLQDVYTGDRIASYVATDGTSIQLEDLTGANHRLVPAGTELSFPEAAPAQLAYKGRPLNGIWATAPYLHNGSVPTLNELLKPPSKRKVHFQVGSREFDPVNVGFVDEGKFRFDTLLPGNSNAGHDYRKEFTPEERMQLIEYLKSL